jgi:hypothetical protein
MRRAQEISALYESVSRLVRRRLGRSAERLLGADLCDREAQVRAVNLAIEEHLAEEGSSTT